MINKKIKFGLIGLGHLGKYHLKHLSSFDFVEMVGIYDIDNQLSKNLALEYNIPKITDLEILLNTADAVSIVTPTITHIEIALKALEKKCHVFIEKPISHSVETANQIKKYTDNKIIHVGHIERFNPAFTTFMRKKHQPVFLECHRLTKINNRSMDISVILDLMIHDIDLLINLIDSPINEIIADGISVVSENIDLANVKLIFKNGCVANLTASRISNKSMRKIRVFEKKLYTSIDLLNKEISEYNAIQNQDNQDFIFNVNKIKVQEQDALACELTHFCDAIFNKDYNNKNISSAILALDVANQINHIIQNKHNYPK